MKEIYKQFGCDDLHRKQAIFSSLFIMQNRMQTAGEKILKDITMKQWLVIAMTGCCPPPRTLTKVGKLMGCSRQNVKTLARALEEKGFVRLVAGSQNSVCIELTEKAQEYTAEFDKRTGIALNLLFSEFSEEEIKQLYILYMKLYDGLDKVEDYAKQ